MKIGTMRGRHAMPADYYLLKREVEPGKPAYDAAYAAGYWFARDVLAGWETVELYYTGLTEVTLGALDGLYAGARGSLDLTLMRWDQAAQEYQPLEIGPSGVPCRAGCGAPARIPVSGMAACAADYCSDCWRVLEELGELTKGEHA